MLTAKELVRAVKEVKEEVVSYENEKKGAKIVESNKVTNESEVIERVNTLMCPLTQPRVSIKSSLSEALWCPDTKSVIITRNTGKQELGPLCPEEALQLLENNSLYLTRGGVPMSIQAAYTLLLSPVTGITTSMYLVYSKLSRAGYRVVRHQGMMEQSVVAEKEDNIVDNDEDIDKSQLAPLYGVPLVCDSAADPPACLEDIRDTMTPDIQDDIPQSPFGLHSWIRNLVEDLVENALSCSEQERMNRNGDQMSPKYEVHVSDDEEDRFVPEIVTIEEESEDEQINECPIEGNSDRSDGGDDEENGSSEVSQLYINPFHEDEASDQENDSNSHKLNESESPYPDILLDKSTSPTVMNKSTLKELESMNNFHNIVREEVQAHVAKAREESNKSSSNSNFQTSEVFSCKLCSVSCCTKDQLQIHYQGKSHMRKLKMKSGGSEHTCDVCGIKASSSVTLQSHFEGKKHLKAVASRALRTLSTPTYGRVEQSNTTSRQGSSTPVDEVLIVEDETMGSQNCDIVDVELLETDDDNAASFNTKARSRREILSDIPNFDGKSLLILNRPARNLLPNNTWPFNKHNSFLEVDKFINTDSEKQDASQIVFEHNELRGHIIQSELNTKNQAKNVRAEAVEIGIIRATDSSEIIVLEDDAPTTSRKPVTSPLLKPFRGFWSASEVSTPLASVHGTFVQIINFGFHAKPPRTAVPGKRNHEGRSKMCFEGGNLSVERGNWKRRRIETKGKEQIQSSFPSRCRGQSTRRGTGIMRGQTRRKIIEGRKSADTHTLAEEIMGIGIENDNLDVEDIVKRARVWVKSKESELNSNYSNNQILTRKENSHMEEPATDVVDLSSSDDDKIDTTENHENLSFNISDVRSVAPESTFEPFPPHHQHERQRNPSSSSESASYSISGDSSSDLDDVSAHSELKHFKTGPLASIWSYEGHVGPLISPEMGGSLREVYSRITMDTLSNKKYKGPVETLNVTYDLYLAENYKKSQKPPPDYRVIIQSMSSNLPNMKSLNMLDKSYPDKIPFLFAVVSGGTVTFFSIDRVELPRYFRDI